MYEALANAEFGVRSAELWNPFGTIFLTGGLSRAPHQMAASKALINSALRIPHSELEIGRIKHG